MKYHQVILATFIHFFAPITQASTWDVADGFSSENNPNGEWTYGYYLLPATLGYDLPLDPQTFIKLKSSEIGSSYASWLTPPEISVLSITKIKDRDNLIFTAGFAPYTAFYAPVVRWTAPTNGEYSISAAFTYSGIGAANYGVSQVGLRTENATLAYAYIGGPDGYLNVEETISLSTGQHLDFFVAKGQHSISLNSTISAVPEPSTYLLFIASAVVFRRRITNRSR